MTYDGYIAYFKDIAIRLKDIAHTEGRPKFSAMDVTEAALKLRSELDMTTPVMVLVNYQGELEPMDLATDVKECGFIILQNCPVDDMEAYAAVINRTEAIAKKVVTKMRADLDDESCNMPFRGLGQIRYNKVGPRFDNAYGWFVSFSITDTIDLTLNPSDWL